MANKKINELLSRTPSLTDLMLVGDPSSGYSYKCTVNDIALQVEIGVAGNYVTLATAQTISGAKTFSNVLTLTSVANSAVDTDKFLVLTASNTVNYRTGAEVLSDIGAQGALSLSAIGSTPNANGATLSSNTLTLQPASASFGGVMTTGFQEFAGQKRFVGNPIQFDKHLEIKNNNTWGVSWGYTSFASKDTPVFGFLRGHSFTPSPTSYNAWFTYGSTGDRNYTLPSSDGTLALTSDVTGAISGTTNYIPKFTGASSIGNSVIYESSSNIGIGTTSPASKLHIVSVGTAGNSLPGNASTIFEQSGNNVISVSGGSADEAGFWFARGTSAYYGGVFRSNDALVFRNNDSERMRLDASGNLGLGTSSTGGARLYVNGASLSSVFDNTTGVYSRWKYNGGNVGIIGTANQIIGGASNTGFALGTESNDYVLFVTNNTERMRLDASGNLGLGVTPSAWGSGRTALQLGNDNSYIVGSRNTVIGNNAYNDGTNWRYLTSSINAHIYAQLEGGNHAWYTAPSGTAGNAISFTQAMTLNASGRLLVGGTSDNGLRLQVTGDIYASNEIYLDNGKYLRLQRSSGGLSTQALGIPSGTDDVRLLTTGDFNVVNGSLTNLMTVKNGGNVGIGTTSPIGTLDVANLTPSLYIRNTKDGSWTSGETVGALNFYTNDVSVIGAHIVSSITSIHDGVSTTAPAGALVFSTAIQGATVTEKMRITSGGLVGIGTSSPTVAKLQSVTDGTLPQLALQSTDASGVAWRFTEFAGTLTIDPVSGTSRTIKFTNSGAGSLTTIIAEGNVGIGTTSPTFAGGGGLHINQSGTDTRLHLTNSTTGALSTDGFELALVGNDVYYDSKESAGTHIFYTAGSERMRITSDGNVGIGTSTILNTAANRTSVTINGTNTSVLTFANGGVAKGYIYNFGTNIDIYSAGATLFTAGGSEKMRISSTGDVFVGKTALSYLTVGCSFEALGTIGATRSSDYSAVFARNTTDGGVVQFRKDNVAVGSISVTSTTTAYNTSSDYRLKQDLKAFNGLSLIDSIKVYDYQWKSDSTRSYGVMAHELQSVIPYAVIGVKDGEHMQGVDYSKLVPVLVQAIKDLKAEIETLKIK